MTEPKFTPGPWLIGMEKRGSIYRPCIVAGNTKIVSVSRKEDAALIAAAPDMYAALESACTVMSVGYVCTKMCQGCPLGKALRKARGENEVSE